MKRIWVVILLLFSITIYSQNATRLTNLEVTGTTTLTGATTQTGALTVTGAITGNGGLESNGDITLENDEIIDNGTDAIVNVFFNDSAANLAEFNLSSSIDTPNVVDNHAMVMNFEFNDDSSGLTDWGQIKVTATDVSDESEDSKIEFKTFVGGTQTTPLALIGKTLVLSNGEAISNATDGTVAITDGTNNLMTIVDGGTTGNVTVTGNLVANGTLEVDGNFIVDSADVAGIGTFTGTATADTVVISGATAGDLYFVQGRGGSVDQQDVLQVEAKADTLIVHRLADGASGLTYNWFRVSHN